MRRDFTVTNAERFMSAARHAYRELHPDADAQEVDAAVTSCAADVVFVVLEYAGLLGGVAEESLQRRAADGLASGAGEPRSSSTNRTHCAQDRIASAPGDMFALPDGGDQPARKHLWIIGSQPDHSSCGLVAGAAERGAVVRGAEGHGRTPVKVAES